MRLEVYAILLFFLIAASCSSTPDNKENITPDTENELRKLVSGYPDSLLLKENLVQYLRENGNYDKAISETETALKLDTLNDRLLDIKGTLHFETGDTIKAIKSFEKAISINPRPEYIMSLGSLYAQTNNPLALAVADTLLRSTSVNGQKQALFIKGLYFSYAGNKIRAIIFFNACLKLDYRYILAYREKAICLYDLNKYATAVDVLKSAVAVQNTFDEGYYWMGRCYEKLGKTKEAIDNYQSALKIDPDYVEAKDALKRLE